MSNPTFASLTYDQVSVWKGAISGRQEAVQRSRANPNFDRSPAITKAMEDLKVASRELSNESLVVPAAGSDAAHQQKLAELGGRVERLQQRLASFGRRSMVDLSDLRVHPSEIAHVIPSDAALVDLLEYKHWSPPAKGKKGVWEPRILAFVLRHGKVPEPIDLGSSAMIADSVAAWRKTYGMPAAGGPDSGQELRRRVWDKIEPGLDGAQTILISPDGAIGPTSICSAAGQKTGHVFDRREVRSRSCRFRGCCPNLAAELRPRRAGRHHYFRGRSRFRCGSGQGHAIWPWIAVTAEQAEQLTGNRCRARSPKSSASTPHFEEVIRKLPQSELTEPRRRKTRSSATWQSAAIFTLPRTGFSHRAVESRRGNPATSTVSAICSLQDSFGL